MAMSDKDRADAEAAARRIASAEDGRCNGSPTLTNVPNRRFWQIHLSTVVVLMFVIGSLLFLNFRPREYGQFQDQNLNPPYETFYDVHLYRHGWPFDLCSTFVHKTQPDAEFRTNIENTRISFQWFKNVERFDWMQFQWQALIFNILIGLAIIVTFIFINEWLIRCEARKP